MIDYYRFDSDIIKYSDHAAVVGLLEIPFTDPSKLGEKSTNLGDFTIIGGGKKRKCRSTQRKIIDFKKKSSKYKLILK